MTNTEARDPLLGGSLRKAREASGLTGGQLAERAGWTTAGGGPGTGKSKVSKIESGKQIPSTDDIDAWAAATGVNDRLREQWKAMAAQAEELRSGYRKRASQGQQPVQKEYNDLAAQTTRFRFFEMTFIPRYLQVPDYSRAVIQEHHDKHGTINDVEAAAQERQGSVRYLYDTNKTFTFLIDEPVLRRRRFPASIMRPQLDRLMSIIGLGNVTLAIYPSLSRPVHSLTESSFELFDDIGYIETALEDAPRLLADDVERLEELFNRYWQDAVTGDDARQIILDAIAAQPLE
jgi:transcriptional regulator with XRE-family HTH domain